MFKKIKAKLAQLAVKPEPIDVSEFGDSLAESVSWSPAKGGGTNIKTHSLAKEDYNRYSFKATYSAVLFFGVFVLFGAIFPIVFITSNSEGVGLVSWESLGVIGFGLIFMGAGLFMGYRFMRPIVFDKSVGFFWKGWKQPEMYGSDNPKGAIRLSDIHAFQILSEYIKSDNSSYHSYELNLILKDGNRHNVIDHGKLSALREDAKELSKFLGKPVWDITERSRR
ncbi:MAG: hypothetical protein WD357_03070 [Gracilimonas sp.]